MTMKKSLIAVAVASAASVPMAAQAAPELYGIVDIGVESLSTDDGGSGVVFGGLNSVGSQSDDKDFTLSNGLQSRLGVRGSEDLGNGLTASYRMEFAVDVLNESGGSTAGTANGLTTRLGWAALSGDWGQIKAGAQWQDTFAYAAWNTHRTDVHGYGAYYYTTGLMPGSLGFGFRQDSTISYQYGGGGYSTDPFTFSVQANIGEDFGAAGGNEDGISAISAYAAGTFGPVTINGGVVSTSVEPGAGGSAAEPSLYNIGGRWRINDTIELGTNFTQADSDNANDLERDSFTIAGFFTFSDGWSAHLGLGTGSEDSNGVENDLDSDVYGYVKKALSSRTDIRLEFENAQVEGTAGSDPESSVFLLALQHNF